MTALGRALASDKTRFVLAGGSTTVVSYIVYVALLVCIPPFTSYAVAYATGLVWSYFVVSLWVFRTPASLRGLIVYPFAYVPQIIASLTLFHALTTELKVAAWLAPILITAAMLPVTYVLSRALVRASSRARKNQLP